MGKAKSVAIGGIYFPTQEKAMDFYRDIRDAYKDGERVSREHDLYLREMVTVHPDAKEKYGCGIDFFTVGKDKMYGTTRCFYIHRKDGTSTDVSFPAAVKGKNDRKDRLQALRHAVEGQVYEFKNSAFSKGEAISCPVFGTALRRDKCHVDHAPPNTFMQLVNRWLKMKKMKLKDVSITPTMDNQFISEMTDSNQLVAWRQYHADNAQLRLLSPLANLSRKQPE